MKKLESNFKTRKARKQKMARKGRTMYAHQRGTAAFSMADPSALSIAMSMIATSMHRAAR